MFVQIVGKYWTIIQKSIVQAVKLNETKNELRQYNPELLDKGRLLAISKSDMLDDQLKADMEKQIPEGVRHIFISSITGEGLKELKDMLWEELNA